MHGLQRKLTRWLLFLLVASVPLVFSYQANLLKEALTHLLAASMASLWLFSTAGRKGIKGTRPVLALPLVGLLGASALSLVAAGFSFQGLVAFYQLLIFVLIYALVASHLRGESQVLRLSALMAFTAFIVSLVGIYQVLFPGSFHTWLAQGAAISTLANTNHVGGYLATAIPLTLALALSGRTPLLRALFGAFALTATIALILTAARGAWVGFAGAMVVMAALLVWGPHRRMQAVHLKKIVLIGGLGLLLALGSGELLFQRRGEPILSRIATIFDPSYPTNRFRLEWWAETLQMIKDQPLLGVGIGNFALARIPYARHIDPSPTKFLVLEHPHNEYLHAAVEMGLVGLVVYVWLLFSIGRLAWWILGSARSLSSYVMAAGFAGGLAGGLTHSLFFYPWHSVSSALNLWVILGLLEVLCRNEGGSACDAETSIGRGRWFRLLAFAVVAILWLGFYRLSFKPFMADLYLQRGNLKILFASPAEALADLRRSVAWEELGVHASMRMGEVYFGAGKYQEAIRHYQDAVERSPTLPTAHANLGLSFYMAGLPDRAKEAYLKALKINPNFPVAHNNLGNVFLDEGRYTAAVEEYTHAITLNPLYANAHYNLGLALSGARNPARAVEAYREAARLNPAMAEAWYNLAAVQARLGRKAEALESLAKAVTVDAEPLQDALKHPDLAALATDEGFRKFLGHPVPITDGKGR